MTVGIPSLFPFPKMEETLRDTGQYGLERHLSSIAQAFLYMLTPFEVISDTLIYFRYPGQAKCVGFQYPGGLVTNTHLYVSYSIGKEDIAISQIPLSAIDE